MRSTVVSLAILAATAGTLATTARAQEAVGRDQEVWTWSDRVARGDWFHFASRMGDVTVTEGTSDRVEVRAQKILRRGRATDISFIVVRYNDGVTICAVYDEDECDDDGIHSDWRGRRSRDLAGLAVTIRLPRGVKVRAQSGNGEVNVSGATDEVIAASGNGKVGVNGSGGSVKASSGNGEVSVTGAKGPVNASSGNGDVMISTSTGPVSASSGNGDIIVTMSELGQRERMDFSTGNGRIRLSLPSNFAAEIDASTGNGEIDSDFPITVTGKISKSRVRGTIGTGGPRVKLISGNGRIELRKQT